MSRAKMTTFDPAELWADCKKKSHANDENTYKRIAKVIDRAVDTVKDYFRTGVMPEERMGILCDWAYTIPSPSDAEEETPAKSVQIGIEELIETDESELPWITEKCKPEHCSSLIPLVELPTCSGEPYYINPNNISQIVTVHERLRSHNEKACYVVMNNGEEIQVQAPMSAVLDTIAKGCIIKIPT